MLQTCDVTRAKILSTLLNSIFDAGCAGAIFKRHGGPLIIAPQPRGGAIVCEINRGVKHRNLIRSTRSNQIKLFFLRVIYVG